MSPRDGGLSEACLLSITHLMAAYLSLVAKNELSEIRSGFPWSVFSVFRLDHKKIWLTQTFSFLVFILPQTQDSYLKATQKDTMHHTES